MPPRARSTTPRRVRTGLRSQSYVDEWLQSSGDEKDKIKEKEKEKERTPASRPIRPRRASELPSSRPPLRVEPTVGARETEAKLDRYEKENWDLKHRIMLQDNRIKKLNEKIEQQAASFADFEKTQKKLEHVQGEVAHLKRALETERLERTGLEDTNQELNTLVDDLHLVLEERESELTTLRKDTTERQAAIEEAAGIIQNLEQRLDEAQGRSQLQASPPRPDSDYFSGDAEVSEQGRLAPHPNKVPKSSHSQPDSDYFSADTSPLVTPKTARQPPTAVQRSPLNAAQQSSAAFNREVGIRSITSKDSLFAAFIESPKLPPPTPPSRFARLNKALRKRTASPKLSTIPDKTNTPHKRSPLIGHTSYTTPDSRPLRSLYMTGELGVQVNSDMKPIPPMPLTQGSSSGSSPYSSSPDESTTGVAKSRSMTSIPVPQSPPRSRLPGLKKGAFHTRSNSTNSRTNAPLTRQSTTPSRQLQRVSPTRSVSDSRRSQYSTGPSTPQPIPTQQVSPQAYPQRASTVSPNLGHRHSSSTSSRQGNQLNMMPATYASPPAQSAPTYSVIKPTTRTHRTPPPPNESMWPRRYPAWPPSAGLRNRDLHVLYHGDGEERASGSSSDEG